MSKAPAYNFALGELSPAFYEAGGSESGGGKRIENFLLSENGDLVKREGVELLGTTAIKPYIYQCTWYNSTTKLTGRVGVAMISYSGSLYFTRLDNYASNFLSPLAISPNSTDYINAPCTETTEWDSSVAKPVNILGIVDDADLRSATGGALDGSIGAIGIRIALWDNGIAVNKVYQKCYNDTWDEVPGKVVKEDMVEMLTDGSKPIISTEYMRRVITVGSRDKTTFFVSGNMLSDDMLTSTPTEIPVWKNANEVTNSGTKYKMGDRFIAFGMGVLTNYRLYAIGAKTGNDLTIRNCYIVKGASNTALELYQYINGVETYYTIPGVLSGFFRVENGGVLPASLDTETTFSIQTNGTITGKSGFTGFSGAVYFIDTGTSVSLTNTFSSPKMYKYFNQIMPKLQSLLGIQPYENFGLPITNIKNMLGTGFFDPMVSGEEIRFIQPNNGLIVGTNKRVGKVEGTEQIYSPGNLYIFQPLSEIPCALNGNVAIKDLFFFLRADRKALYRVIFNPDVQSFQTAIVSAQAGHLFANKVIKMASIKIPQSIILALCEDGSAFFIHSLGAMNVAMTRFTVDGTIEDICAGSDESNSWFHMVIKRGEYWTLCKLPIGNTDDNTVNNPHLDFSFVCQANPTIGLKINDVNLTIVAPPNNGSIGTTDAHKYYALEGKVVVAKQRDIVFEPTYSNNGGGAIQYNFTPANISIDSAINVYIGQRFKAELETVPMYNLPGTLKRAVNLGITFTHTYKFYYYAKNYNQYFQQDTSSAQMLSPETGEKQLFSSSGFDDSGSLIIGCDSPTPCKILGVMVEEAIGMGQLPTQQSK